MGNRIRTLRRAQKMSQEELAIKCKYSDRTSIAKIESGLVNIPQSKIILLADALNVSPEYILTGETEKDEEQYFVDPETTQIAQEIFENKELRLLFDSAKDSSPEDLKAVHDMLLALKRKENHDD